MARPGADYDVNAAGTADVDAAVAAHGDLRLVGYAIKESAATPAAAAVEIVAGATANGGDAIIPITLLPGESTRDMNINDGEGIKVPGGLSINRSAGNTTVVLFYKGNEA